MCGKTLLKNIYQRINAGKLWAIRLLKVPFQLLLIIIVICIVVKFFPDKFADFLGIKKETEDIMSFIELIIEGIFCVFVLKEFKMTRKSFEWQKKEQEEREEKKIDEKIKFLCSYIIISIIQTMYFGREFATVNEILSKYGNPVNSLFGKFESMIVDYLRNKHQSDNIRLRLSAVKQMLREDAEKIDNVLVIRLKQIFSYKEINEIYEQLTK